TAFESFCLCLLLQANQQRQKLPENNFCLSGEMPENIFPDSTKPPTGGFFGPVSYTSLSTK
ncbi:hypothetical protein, partial [Pantoea dispersa]|uniref:hypothetical protein n=1 Tax=Pantoea dispersa TaxID=59814 RepID=UPI0030170BC8